MSTSVVGALLTAEEEAALVSTSSAGVFSEEEAAEVETFAPLRGTNHPFKDLTKQLVDKVCNTVITLD